MTSAAGAARLETTRGPVEIRELVSLSEVEAAEEIQARVWGPGVHPHPKELLIPIQHEGGLLAGAFDPRGTMIGLVFGFPTRDPQVMHSQLLATLEQWRGEGIGAQLKWFQRRWCLERGFRKARWTVDPLRAANAALNIGRLGAVANTYYHDYYGTMQGIDQGSPTDRLLIEWDLAGPRATARETQAAVDNGFLDAEPANAVEDGKPISARLGLTGARILIRLPDHFIQLAADQLELALQWRMQTRALFQHYFAGGYTITEFTRAGGPAYLLEKGYPND